MAAEQAFNLEAWLKTIDINDEKWDYVMHNSHWLTSEWSDTCPQCLAKGKKPSQPPLRALATSSPIKSETISPNSMNQTASQTLKLIGTSDQINDLPQASSPEKLVTPEPMAAFMTPIAPPMMSSAANQKHFVTPATFNKNTYSRSTRQSTKKKQMENQPDLVNETFDMYTSALAETPDVGGGYGGGAGANETYDQSRPASKTNGSGATNLLISPLTTVTKIQPPPPHRVTTNFELLSSLNTNNGNNSFIFNNQAPLHETEPQQAFNHHQQPVTSKIPARTGIPRIPVRSSQSKNNGY